MSKSHGKKKKQGASLEQKPAGMTGGSSIIQKSMVDDTGKSPPAELARDAGPKNVTKPAPSQGRQNGSQYHRR